MGNGMSPRGLLAASWTVHNAPAAPTIRKVLLGDHNLVVAGMQAPLAILDQLHQAHKAEPDLARLRVAHGESHAIRIWIRAFTGARGGNTRHRW